ncbi:universal stress protein [Rhodococcus sp. HNM0569]|uniref:universal stress protein n=1 Tax=Rhodococcus sp. HNM0569 TaxID=2716340 RepID=UPI00146E46DE|nr:universal stress protein [Rhodococcus sp. HNM0569]NLU82377.1 universal stress protein [Rhodococcus sp. HNM0569]
MSTTPGNNTVVVGVDGSDTALGAARWAAALATRWRADVLLCYALPQDGPLYSPAAVIAESQFLAQVAEDGRALLDSARETLANEFPDVSFDSRSVPGPASTGLLEAAEHARMIVLGRTGAGAIRSRLIGSTALHVVNKATCPVTVWTGPGTGTTPGTGQVVVGVDGGKVSDRAVHFGFEFASYFDAEVTAVHAWGDSSGLGPGGTGMFVDWNVVAEEEAALLSEALSGVTADFPDVPVTRISEQGRASDVVLAHAGDAQLIVLGTRGRGALASALLGSTSQNVLHHATCPVAIDRWT